MSVDETKRLKQLEAENTRLKKLVAERDLEIEVMKEVAAKKVSASSRRRQVEVRARTRGVVPQVVLPDVDGAVDAWI